MNISLGEKEIMANNICRHIEQLGLNVEEFAAGMGFNYPDIDREHIIAIIRYQCYF